MSPQRLHLTHPTGQGTIPTAGPIDVSPGTTWSSPFAPTFEHGRGFVVDERGSRHSHFVSDPSSERGIVDLARAARAAFARHVAPGGLLGWDAMTLIRLRRDLGGRDLACTCPLRSPGGAPLACHADTLLTLANNPLAR